jgi:hypothetical protein
MVEMKVLVAEAGIISCGEGAEMLFDAAGFTVIPWLILVV